jgi:hypothetical protein
MNFKKTTFVGHFCPPGSGSGIRIRIHWPDWIRIQSGSATLTTIPASSKRNKKVSLRYWPRGCWGLGLQLQSSSLLSKLGSLLLDHLIEKRKGLQTRYNSTWLLQTQCCGRPHIQLIRSGSTTIIRLFKTWNLTFWFWFRSRIPVRIYQPNWIRIRNTTVFFSPNYYWCLLHTVATMKMWTNTDI